MTYSTKSYQFYVSLLRENNKRIEEEEEEKKMHHQQTNNKSHTRRKSVCEICLLTLFIFIHFNVTEVYNDVDGIGFVIETHKPRMEENENRT